MRGRGYRGWIAAGTSAITFSLVLLVVEKHLSLTASSILPSGIYNPFASTEKQPDLRLQIDPGLAAPVDLRPSESSVDIQRSMPAADQDLASAAMIQQPPQPAADVVLFEPVADYSLTELPLHSNPRGIAYLMESMDAAFEKPTRFVASTTEQNIQPSPETVLESRDQQAPPAPISSQRKLPEPKSLFKELAALATFDHSRGPDSAGTHLITQVPGAAQADFPRIHEWARQAEELLRRLVFELGLEHADSPSVIDRLSTLAAQSSEIAGRLTDYQLASQINRTGYAIQRRVDVWRSIQKNLGNTSIALSQPRSTQFSRAGLLESIEQVEQLISQRQANPGWIQYLQLDSLRAALADQTLKWQDDDPIVASVLARLRGPQLNRAQRAFLNAPEFEQLASGLAAWGRQSLSLRSLLDNVEELELDPISRIRPELATAIQSLRHSGDATQQQLASALEGHYRNANLRLCVADEFLERFLPDSQYEVRPVRQRILGADTRGQSAIQTQLALDLIPDDTAWNIGIGVTGDMVSDTQSSKGPAVFHSSSAATVNSRRYVRIDAEGHSVSAEPTSVQSRDYLKKMSTDYDSFPVVGDFVRLLVREQFNQKRGLAQRITRRLIASETDQELDKRLEEGIADAETKLREHIVGPLEQMRLNPSVVSMNTTENRLAIRYRVAHPDQTAAFTPRPRAPGDSLVSMQLHESSINNMIEQLGLSGRTWTLAELYQHLGTTLNGNEWMLPEDVPGDVMIRFADTRPATVELRDGTLRLTLRIALLSQPARKLSLERFLVHSTYIPVASGMDATLVRDEGGLEIVTPPNKRFGDRALIRFIFARIFVARPDISIISESWKTDERASDLAVSQLDIRDGWLAVAVSHADSQRAAEVAARALQILK